MAQSTAKIGLNLASIRGQKPEDTPVLVEKAAKAGFDGVEIIRYTGPGADPNVLTKIFKDNNILCSGLHAGYDPLQNDLSNIIDFALALGAPYVICPRLPEELRNPDGVRKAAAAFAKAGEGLKKHGVPLMYQHHDWELKKFDGKDAGKDTFDIMAEEVPADLLLFHIETYWLAVCRVDPLAYIGRFKDRCPNIQIGDLVSKEVAEYTELGKGIVDLKGITSRCRENGVKWYQVCQEHYQADPASIDMFAVLQRGCAYLRSLI